MTSANFRMVRLARELRGLSQTGAAKAAGVPQPLLSRIEADMRQADAGEVERLAAAFAVPTGFFMEPDTPAAAPLFRKRAIRSVTKNRMIQARINTAVLAARRILDAGIDIDVPLAFPEPGEMPREDPMASSHLLRQAWRLPDGRLDNVTEAIEAAGGIVLHVDFGTEDASAAFVSTLDDPRLWFLVNTREFAGDRVRLSLAHELGHAVMHRYLAVKDESRLEPEAYEFAIAFTLPPQDFNRHVDPNLTLRRSRDLKRAYWISIQAITRAARDRQLISATRHTSLYKQISARGWRRSEPDPIPVEQPSVWPNALEVHRKRHGYTDDELAHIARLSAADLGSLFPNDFSPGLRVVGGQARPVPAPGQAPSLQSV